MNPVFDKLGQKPAQSPSESGSAAKKITHAFILILIALAGASIFTARFNPAHMDYISYWSAAKLLVHHGNPYSPASVFSLEKPLGFLLLKPLVMRNPPWALFLVIPLGLVGPRAGLILWTVAIASSIVFSVYLIHPRLRDKLLALFFAPAIACLASGQSSAFLLLGFALFLYFHQRRPFLAGAALLLMAFKPHLFLVFWAVLLAESAYRRKFRTIAGGAAALALTSAFAMCFDVQIWQHYLAMLRWAQLSNKALPTISMLFRMMIDPRAFWLLFVPSALAVPWAIWYYVRNREVWNWRRHGMLLMLVTIMVSPYGFITDEIVLLPPIIFALSIPEKRKYAAWLLLIINSTALYLVVVNHAALSSHAYIWTPFAWLAWFLYATRGSRDSEPSQGASANVSELINTESASPAVI